MGDGAPSPQRLGQAAVVWRLVLLHGGLGNLADQVALTSTCHALRALAGEVQGPCAVSISRPDVLARLPHVMSVFSRVQFSVVIGSSDEAWQAYEQVAAQLPRQLAEVRVMDALRLRRSTLTALAALAAAHSVHMLGSVYLTRQRVLLSGAQHLQLHVRALTLDLGLPMAASDLDLLEGIECLTFIRCDLPTLRMCARSREVVIRSCKLVDGVSLAPLRDVDSVTLFNVHGLDSVEELAGGRGSIVIDYCITEDLGPLQSYQAVSLCSMNLRTIEPLASVPMLSLKAVGPLDDMNTFMDGVLQLSLCDVRLPDMTLFENVTWLELDKVIGLVSLPGLAPSLRHLTVSNCSQLRDVRELRTCRTGLSASIRACESLQSLVGLEICSRVELADLILSDLRPLNAVPVVVLRRCTRVTNLAPLAIAQEVHLEHMRSISNVACLTNVDWQQKKKKKKKTKRKKKEESGKKKVERRYKKKTKNQKKEAEEGGGRRLKTSPQSLDMFSPIRFARSFFLNGAGSKSGNL